MLNQNAKDARIKLGLTPDWSKNHRVVSRNDKGELVGLRVQIGGWIDISTSEAVEHGIDIYGFK